jgi:hypothetical protein
LDAFSDPCADGTTNAYGNSQLDAHSNPFAYSDEYTYADLYADA